MKAKTVFIIVLTALVTIILMKNADEVEFWIFGTYLVPKLAVLGTMFVIGIAVGLMIGRGKKKQLPADSWPDEDWQQVDNVPVEHPLDEDDKDYIK